MSAPPPGITILNVRHASRVAAIQTALGPTRLLESGLATAFEAAARPVRVVDVPVPAGAGPGEIARAFAVADSIGREAGG